ncbi:MAG TPA: hypothetical protein VHX63_09085 [Acidobacteriaceae bacterium]|jgi:hypothetical protein|nr:hypothetical protein [Acidobacteriaceae bacterium]
MRTFLLLLLAFSSALALAQDAKQNPRTISLSDAITQVNLALQDYQTEAEQSKSKLPPLKSADFDFKTTTDRSAGATFTFLIFTIGGSRSDESVNDVAFHYEVPKAPKLQSHGLGQPVQLREQLTKTIEAAAQSLQDAPALKGLAFSKLSVTISYGVKWTVTGGISVPMLVTSGLNAGKDRNSIQTIQLQFAD